MSGSELRYAIAGLGARSRTYQDALHDRAERGVSLVACLDSNPGRSALATQVARERGQAAPRLYSASELERMLAETQPHVLIVTTPDWTHDAYVSTALDRGVDVIVEKPMAVTAAGCQRVIDSVRSSGRRCRVAFNYRYSPVRAQLKEMLASGVIGEVRSVDFHWMLDTYHGADYFRRWHSYKRNSGGLLVHKATHHFDLVNWWLSALPVRVSARGQRQFYTPSTARRLGLRAMGERCHTCPERTTCPLVLDLAADADLQALYLDNEKHDGYLRDRCVFRPDIEIEDTMVAWVEYDTGALLSYSLNAFCSWEGYSIVFNGSHGRIEYREREKTPHSPLSEQRGALLEGGTSLVLHELRKPPVTLEPRRSAGSHGGGDRLMLQDLLDVGGMDPLRRAADERSGAYSILVGIAANQSLETGRAVTIAELVSGLERPEYTSMPDPAAEFSLASA
jgi:predicted dehydrogenase